MKNIFKYIILSAAVIFTTSCARLVTEGANENIKRYLDAWLEVNTISKDSKIGRGVYVMEYDQIHENGLTVQSNGYAIVEYKILDLQGNITDGTNWETADQLGTLVPGNYYGPQVWTTTPETIRAGLLDGIMGMKLQERKKFLVPAWLMSYQNYETEEEYFEETSDASTTIFDVKVVDFTMDINEWQFVKMIREFNKDSFYNGRFKGTSMEDTVGVSYGMFYKTITEVAAEEAFKSDTTIYINYVGKLVDGHVFDTNIRKVALDNDLPIEGRTFAPVSIQWSEEYSGIRMNDSEVIPGFSKTLMQMAKLRKGSKGLGMFYSELGYSYSGTSSIPGYAPLIFEIEFVDKPEE